MDKLLKLAVEAHGGLRAWNRLRTLAANVSIGGALWDLKKLPGLVQLAKAKREAAPDVSLSRIM